MKKKPQQCTRQGKSNTNIKSFLSNLKENDLHFEDSQITQCVFLGVLRLKPVPSVFSSNNVPSVAVENKSKRFNNNNSTKEINKNVSRKKDINKVISGRIRKKNPEKIKASIKKLPTKKPVIKLNFNMNREKKVSSSTNVPETVRILPESLTKITPESVFTNQTITLNPITTVPTFNPVQNLFDKLKQQLDGRRSTEISKQSLFFNELLDIGNIQSSKKQKKSNKKNKSDRLTSLPSCSSFSDTGYHSSNSSINTNTKSTDNVILFNDNNVEDEEDCEVLLNSGPMPSFVLQSNNDVILIPDDRSSPNRDLIVIEDTRNVRISPRLNKNEQNSEIINVEEGEKKAFLKEKTIKRRRTLMPTAIPSIFFNTPRLLRSELGQKKSSLESKSLKSVKVENKQEKLLTKPKKDIKTKSTENLIYEVVKCTESNKPTENESNFQDHIVIVENSPPKVEPLIIKLKKSTDQNGNEDIKSKEKTQKPTKNLFFPRLLRSDIHQQKEIKNSNKPIETITSDFDTSQIDLIFPSGKISVKSTKDLFEDNSNSSLPDNSAEKTCVEEKLSSNEKSPLGTRRTLRSDVCLDESSSNVMIIEDIQETIEIMDNCGQLKTGDEAEIIDVDKNVAEKQVTTESVQDEIIDVDLYEEKSNNVNNNNDDTENLDTTEIININEGENIQEDLSESDVIDVDKSEDESTKNPSKFKSIAVVQPMSRQPKTPQKKLIEVVPKETVNSSPDKYKKNKKKSGDVEAQTNTIEERRQLRSDDTLKLPNENLTQKKLKSDGKEATEASVPDKDLILKISNANEVTVSNIDLNMKNSNVDGDEAKEGSVSDTDLALEKLDGDKTKEDVDENSAKPRSLRSNVAQKEEEICDKIDAVEDGKVRMLRSSNVKESSDEKVQDKEAGDIKEDNEESGDVIEKSEPVKGYRKIKKKNKKVVVKKSLKKPLLIGKSGKEMKSSKKILLKSRKMLKKNEKLGKKFDFGHKITADYQIMNQADLIVNTTRKQVSQKKVEQSTDILNHPGISTNTQRSKSKEKSPKKLEVSQNQVDTHENGTAKVTTTKETMEKVPKNKKLIKQKKLTTKLVKNMKKVGRPKKSVKTADVKQAETLIVHKKRGTTKSNESVGVKEELNGQKKLGKRKISVKLKTKKKQEDLDVIKIVSEKRTNKKQGNISPKFLRSSLNPIIKEEVPAVPIVEKVVALIHNEPKPKDFYKNVDESERNVDKNQSRTLRSKNLSDNVTMEGRKNKGMSKRKNLVKKSKVISKKKEKVIAKSKLSKIPNKQKQKMMKKFKNNKKNNKTTKKNTRKSNIDWKNNDIIERIIQEIKNTIFKQGSNENIRRRTTVAKTKKTVKQKTKMVKKKKKKVIQAAKKKMQQTKEALKQQLRSARTKTTVETVEENDKKEEVIINKSSVIIINEVTVPKPVNIVEKTVPELPTTKKDITVFDFEESEPEMVPLRPPKPNESLEDAVDTEPKDSEPQNQPEPTKKLLYSRIPVDEDVEKEKLSSGTTDSAEYDKRIFFENPSTSKVQKKRLFSEILVYSDEGETATSKRVPEVVEKTVSTDSGRKRKLLIPFLDEDGKPRKLWSIIDNPTPPVSPRKQATPPITPEMTTQSSTTEKSPEPSTSGDKKSPMKQPTIIEMFSKVWMKKEVPAVETASEEQEVFSRPLPRSATVSEPAPPSPARERLEDDDSDTESRVEWIPEEYAEYKYKYSSNKMMQYKPIFKCKICMMMMPSYYKLLKHRKEHEKQDKPYNCPQCGTDFSNVVDFSAHLRIHKGKHPYMCSKCDAGFWTKSAYEAHIPVHILKKAKQPVKKFRCDICAKEFSKLCDVERHTRVHTGEKPCICNICNKRFQQAHNLSKHLITHLHIKPFHCEICNKQFGRNDVLRRHLLTHSVDKPVKCSVCFRGFIRHSQLLQHMRRKHPDTPIDDLREQFGDEEDLSDNREEFDEQPSGSSENKGSIKTEA